MFFYFLNIITINTRSTKQRDRKRRKSKRLTAKSEYDTLNMLLRQSLKEGITSLKNVKGKKVRKPGITRVALPFMPKFQRGSQIAMYIVHLNKTTNGIAPTKF